MHVKESVRNYNAVSTPASVFEEFRELGRADQESFWILGVNAKNRVLLKEMLFLGGISSTSVDLKILFKRLLLAGADGFVCVHSHPSGSAAPSEDDIRLTGIIKSVAVMLEMRLLDHVIVGDNAYCSLKERGLL